MTMATTTDSESTSRLQALITAEIDSLSSPRTPSPAEEAVSALSSPQTIGSLIDHTLLAPAATPQQIVDVTNAAVSLGCKTVCVNSSYIPLVADTLSAAERVNSSLPLPVPIAVVGFPLGAAATDAKVYEAKWAISHGAAEIDMVQHIGKLKVGLFADVHDDLKQVVDACAPVPVKVIIESCLLSRDEIIASCVIAREAGAAFVKTSTGFSTGGATVEAVEVMRAVALKRPGMKVKASGGIGSLADMRAMVMAGAERIGASRTAQILADVEASAASSAPMSTSVDQY